MVFHNTNNRVKIQMQEPVNVLRVTKIEIARPDGLHTIRSNLCFHSLHRDPYRLIYTRSRYLTLSTNMADNRMDDRLTLHAQNKKEHSLARFPLMQTS